MSKEAMKLALEALNSGVQTRANRIDWIEYDSLLVEKAITALREALAEQPAQQCRTDGRCQYAIDSGAEGMGHCPKGKCVMPAQQEPGLLERDQCDRLVALVMSKLASKHSLATLPGDLNLNIMTHHALRHSIVQAAFMAGAVSAPPQAQLKPLTDEFLEALAEKHVTNCYFDTLAFARAIEAKLKEKNT